MFAVIACSVPGTVASGFVASGTITYTTYFVAPDDVFAETTRAFKVTVHEDLWRIDTRRVRLQVKGQPEKGQGREIYHGAWTDGTSVYQLTHFDTGHSSALNAANARIEHGHCPVQFDQMLHDVWVGLASANYFRTQPNSGRGYIHPLINYGPTNFYVRDFRVLANWTLGSAAPFLPNEVCYASAFRFEDPSENLVPVQLPNTNSYVKVLEYHPDPGVQIPARYTVSHFRPTSADWVLGSHSRVIITNVVPSEDAVAIESTLISPPGPTIVLDGRIRDERAEPLIYWVTNQWLSIHDAQKINARWVGSRAWGIARSRLWYGVFAVVLLSPLLALVCRRFVGRGTTLR
ncbi:MAG: hypothetical protein KJ072_19940 [Verrucomicrobia bacterium]|nr:hypothetical protein [Verrucomicrobiota bacterium]